MEKEYNMDVTRYTATDTENILEVLESDGIASLMKFMELALKGLEKDVLSMDLSNKSFAELAITKAKYDGAKLLVNKLNIELNRVAALHAKGKE
jgi:hypothetical protein